MKLGIGTMVMVPVVGMGLLGLLSRARGGDLLPVGTAAPDVTGTDAGGKPVKLSDQKGKFAVVYFYPKDETPGCTKEACAFRDSHDKFAQAGVTVFAVSRDDEASHKQFRDKYKLPFPMVADTSGDVQKAYGVSSMLPGTKMVSRVTFLVGPDGKVAHVWPKVDPVVNAREVLSTVEQLRKTAPH
ncbi:MAG TPA: peroxiredoxin [Polyangia bacterium]|nr:peroxiredoxin [Polyangia bacterium]